MKCADCGKREGVLNFSEGVVSHVHGFTKRICRYCYIEILRGTMFKANQEIKKQEGLIVEELNANGGKTYGRNEK